MEKCRPNNHGYARPFIFLMITAPRSSLPVQAPSQPQTKPLKCSVLIPDP
jgi:hypothetical protein